MCVHRIAREIIILQPADLLSDTGVGQLTSKHLCRVSTTSLIVANYCSL
jgi:hypothetical protein